MLYHFQELQTTVNFNNKEKADEILYCPLNSGHGIRGYFNVKKKRKNNKIIITNKKKALYIYIYSYH